MKIFFIIVLYFEGHPSMKTKRSNCAIGGFKVKGGGKAETEMEKKM
jgi:hypothetical protein